MTAPSIKGRRFPDDRRQWLLLEAGLLIAKRKNYKHIGQRELSEVAGMSHTMLYNYWPTMDDFYSALMTEALERRDIPVLTQGFISHDPSLVDAPYDVRLLVSAHMSHLLSLG